MLEREKQSHRDAVLLEDRARMLAQAESALKDEEERLARLRAEIVADKAQAEITLVEAERRNASLKFIEEHLQRTRESHERDVAALNERQLQLTTHEARADSPIRSTCYPCRTTGRAIDAGLLEQQRLFEGRSSQAQAEISDLARREERLQQSDALLRDREAAVSQQQQALEIQSQQLRAESDRLSRRRESLDLREGETEDREAELERRASSWISGPRKWNARPTVSLSNRADSQKPNRSCKPS